MSLQTKSVLFAIQKTLKKKVKNDFMKWIIVILILAVILIGGCTQQPTGQAITEQTTQQPSQSETPPNQQSEVTVPAQPQIYTGDTENLLPERNEINTEYKIVTTEDFDITNYYSNYQQEGLTTTGFESGSYMEHEIWEDSPSSTITVGYIYILKFDSVDNANSFYTNLINIIKNEGGYKEVSLWGINADCFGVEGFYPDYPLDNYYQDFYCKKKNVFFNTEVSGYKKIRLSECGDWAKTIANKI